MSGAKTRCHVNNCINVVTLYIFINAKLALLSGWKNRKLTPLVAHLCQAKDA